MKTRFILRNASMQENTLCRSNQLHTVNRIFVLVTHCQTIHKHCLKLYRVCFVSPCSVHTLSSIQPADWIVVIRLTRHKISLWRCSPTNLFAWYGKTKPNTTKARIHQSKDMYNTKKHYKLECGPMPNVMVALPNIGGALCSTLQSLADDHY